MIDRAIDHLGRERAARYLRKFYPWYVESLFAQEPPSRGRRKARVLLAALQTANTVEAARALMRERFGTAQDAVPLTSAA